MKFWYFCLFCLIFIELFLKCSGVLPPYLPFLQVGDLERDELIEHYYNMGISYSEILMFLGCIHEIYLSIRQLKRILSSRGLGRRRNRSNLDDVCRVIRFELRGSGSRLGYRLMTRRLLNEHNISVDQETVRELLKILDPDGVAARSRHRLQRREYTTEGPNHVWHIDGYDKLKPFGFCIHGAIDGYSRRVMWLEVGPSNNNPRIIAQYYVDCVQQMGGTSRIIRADCGTENVYVAGLQRFFHNDNESFLYGTSCSNQRIEAFWGMLRKSCIDWWICYFKDLRESSLFCDSNDIQAECLKFCFMNIIQKELSMFSQQWNLHKIRKSTNAESPDGRPDLLYFLPDATSSRDLLTPVSPDQIEIARERCCVQPPQFGCSAEFVELALFIMQENNLMIPTSTEEAIILYTRLIEEIENI